LTIPVDIGPQAVSPAARPAESKLMDLIGFPCASPSISRIYYNGLRDRLRWIKLRLPSTGRLRNRQ
jgi:hypothetical protein